MPTVADSVRARLLAILEGEPIKRGDKVYCCDACAFEALRSASCDDRTDSTVAGPIAEPVKKKREE